MKKVGFVSLGCPKNLVDSEVMMGTLAQSGYEITNDASEADTVVVNTCGRQGEPRDRGRQLPAASLAVPFSTPVPSPNKTGPIRMGR